MTYKDLHDRINAKINSQFPQQTPMLIGEGNRIVLGSDYAKIQYAVSVMQVNLAANPNTICIETGQVAGLRKGAEFVIYPHGTREFLLEKRLAVATITELGATKSWCELKPLPGKELVKQGDQAVLTSASTNLVRKIRLLRLEEAQTENELLADNVFTRKLPQAVYRTQESAFENLNHVLETAKGWIELVSDEDKDNKKEVAHYFVAINKNGEYEICDPTGTPYANMRPPLKVSAPNAATQLVNRLVHVAKYHAAEELDNFDKTNPLLGKLTVEWLGKLSDYDTADPIPAESELAPLSDQNHPTINVGEWIFLRIRNNSSTDLNVAVLDLGSDWSITQAYPEEPASKFMTIERQKEEIFPFHLSLADGYEQGSDIAKVFATVGTPNLRWLELPPLDQPLVPKGIAKPGSEPLEELLAAISEENPKERKLNPAAYPSREWTTKQLKINVKKV